MNNVNTLNTVNIKQKTSNNFSKLPYVLALCAILNIANPTEMKADSIANDNLPCVEVLSDSDIIANIERRTWTKLPDLYNQKLKTFITTNKIMKDEWSAKFTADFVVKQMQSDRWISKQSQLLFIWTHIYNEITGTYLYDWSDGDENRLNEYGNAMDYAENCWKDFRRWYITYTEKMSAEYDKQSAEARQQSAEARQQSAEAKEQAMKLDSLWLKEIHRFYTNFKKNPNTVRDSEIQQATKVARDVIQNCKKYWINYKAILLKEVWDKKKVDAILKFYGVE